MTKPKWLLENQAPLGEPVQVRAPDWIASRLGTRTFEGKWFTATGELLHPTHFLRPGMPPKPQDRFWIVMNEDRGPSSYPFKHYSASGAQVEAQRLARDNPGQKFFVLEMIGFHRCEEDWITFRKPGSQTVEGPLDVDDEIPF